MVAALKSSNQQRGNRPYQLLMVCKKALTTAAKILGTIRTTDRLTFTKEHKTFGYLFGKKLAVNFLR